MKRVIAFLLACLLVAGGIFIAHASITDAQDDILLYPVFEWGDRSLLQDRVLNLSFSNSNHLRWDSRYTFKDGTAATEFTYSRQRLQQDSVNLREFEVYLTLHISTSASHHFELLQTDYGAMVRAAAEGVAENSSSTTDIKMADYVPYYLPDLHIDYQDEKQICRIDVSPYQLMNETPGVTSEEPLYREFWDLFRFPVREEEIVSVTVHKSAIGLIDGYEFNAKVRTELRFYGTATERGIYFLPVFQDASGAPLTYESPKGPGLYFVPWKVSSEKAYWYNADDVPLEWVVPDLGKATLVASIDPGLSIQALELSIEEDRLWLLTRDDDSFDVQIRTLSTGEMIGQTTAIPRQSDYAGFEFEGDYILVASDENLALLNRLGQPLLTAPVERPGERYYIPSTYTPSRDALWFDGETLILACRGETHGTAFWVCIYREGQLLYHGEFDSSLTRSGAYVAHFGKMDLE